MATVHGINDMEMHSKGLLVPFGALCWYKPTPPEEQRLPMAAPRAIPAVFLGYMPQPGGTWQGDYFVAPLQAFSVDVRIAIFGLRAKVPVRIIREIVAPVRGRNASLSPRSLREVQT